MSCKTVKKSLNQGLLRQVVVNITRLLAEITMDS